MTAATTLGDLVAVAAERNPARGFTFLGEDSKQHLSYADLEAVSRALAAAFAEYAAPGARAVMIYPPGLDFVPAFLASARLGLVAVPLSPPAGALEAWVERLESVISDADPALVLTTRELLDLKAAAGLEIGPPHLRWLATDQLADAGDPGWRPPRVSGSDTALIQYTSGSTGQPRGVVLTHANLMANQRCIARGFDFRDEDVVVSWLPVYHDMGLIGCVLQPLFNACDAHLLSPLAFLSRPLRWVEAMTSCGGTVSGGPNFAFELCARRAGDLEAGSAELSRWRIAFSGAEPVRAQTLDRFAAAFAPFGFRREAFYPCYGLAESALIVTGACLTDRPRLLTVDRTALDAGRAEVIADAAACEPSTTTTLVSVGVAVLETEVVIIDPAELRGLPDGQVGEIWVRGPSVAAGYWRNREATRAVFGARPAGDEAHGEAHDHAHGEADAWRPGWLRTGDLGFLTAGQLVVTGRIKELMIIRGRNVHPADVEQAAQDSDGRLRRGCGAAFLAADHGDDGVVLVQETRADPDVASGELLPAVRRSVAERMNLPLAAVVLVPPHTVPKTSSGKLRRLACRELYLSGSFQPLAAWQRQLDAPP